MPKKLDNNLLDLSGSMDPAVEAALGMSEKKISDRRRPMKERKAAAREKAKMEKRADRRVGYDLDPEVISEMAAIAGKNSTTTSSLVNLALHLFLAAFHEGNVDILAYRELAKPNPRYDHVFVFREKEDKPC